MTGGMSDRRRKLQLYGRETLRRTRRRLALFGRMLGGSGPTGDRLLVAPTDLRAIDSFAGNEVLNGRFALAGYLFDAGGKSPFRQPLPSEGFAVQLQSFAWLRHVRADRSDEACANVRRIIDDWIAAHGRRRSGPAWRDEVVARRVAAWLSHSPVILQGAEQGFYKRFMKALNAQITYLQAISKTVPDGENRLLVKIALAMMSICVPVRGRVVGKASRDLDRELERQILADGGHISRNPRATLDLLIDLLPLRQTYLNLGLEVPSKLIPAIDRIYPALRFFRHQNGELALFNGATVTPANELVSVLRYDETAGQPFKALPHMGFHRMAGGQTTVIVDTGFPQSTDLTREAHAGCLSFEMSSGGYRYIVNAGRPELPQEDLQQAARMTAAHSAVTLNDSSHAEFSHSDYLGPIFLDGVTSVEVERKQTKAGHDSLAAVHDGYMHSFGLLCGRELMMNAEGTAIGGRDRFFPPEGGPVDPQEGHYAVARFHIHPAIVAEQTSPDTVLLNAPNGETWRFYSFGNDIVLAESIYFADTTGIRGTEQIEIGFDLGQTPEIRWEISRIR